MHVVDNLGRKARKLGDAIDAWCEQLVTWSDNNKPVEKEPVWEFEFVVLTDGPVKSRHLWKRARPVIASGDKPSILYFWAFGTSGAVGASA
jgi:hypothetical protein